MSERSLKGTWKGRGKKVSTKSSLMIGIVYSALFKDKEVLGVLERVGGIEAYLRTKENKLISVDKRSLKAITV